MPALNGRGERTIVTKTAAYTVTTADVGAIFTNTGAGGAVTFSLPAATVGQWYEFVVSVAQELRVDPNGTETMSLPSDGTKQAAGAYLTANAVGESLKIVCVVAGTWESVSYTGTWTAV